MNRVYRQAQHHIAAAQQAAARARLNSSQVKESTKAGLKMDLRRKQNYRHLRCEHLESRRMLAADLIATDVFLRDHQGNRVEHAPIGEQIEVVATWETRQLAESAYNVLFRVNGFELTVTDVRQGTGQTSAYASLAQFGWYALQGKNTVEVILDPANSLNEASEENNGVLRTFEASIPTPPAIFQWPLVESQFERFGVTSYNDVDPSTAIRDYLGRAVYADGHKGWDVHPGPFAASDAGLEIGASASGTVTWVIDGRFDRETAPLHGTTSNLVIIDHGAGWTSIYGHLRRDSVMVKKGDVVRAGQVIGLVGSSGQSHDPHLHWHLEHNGRPVDPMIGREYYLPPSLQDRFGKTTVQNLGVTNREPLTDFLETTSAIRVFSPDAKRIYLHMNVFGHLASAPIGITIYKPSGARWLTFSVESPKDYGKATWLPRWSLPSNPDLGRWKIVYEARGKQIGEDFLEVSTATIPELSLRHAGAMVTESRWTPFDFASTVKDAPAPSLTFTVENHGSAPLKIQGVEAPDWVRITKAPPSVLDAGKSDTFEISADTTVAGTRWGQIALLTDDASERRSTFQVESVISDATLAATRVGLAVQHAVEGQKVVGKVYRTPVGTQPVVVELTVSDREQLAVPVQVTIPANEAWVPFEIQVLDDNVPESLRRAEIFANPIGAYLPSRSELIIIDDDRVSPSLQLRLVLLSKAVFIYVSYYRNNTSGV